jgi:catalase
MVLDRAVVDNFTENEQIAFGTGVLVDGLDFSDDKMLTGRTFSYSDTQRYRVGPNYLQLPANRPADGVAVNTNQRDSQMAYYVDGHTDPHINFEPALRGGLAEAEPRGPAEVGPVINGRLTRATIPRHNDYQQAADRWQTIEQWERDDIVLNLSGALGQCEKVLQERMVWHLLLIDDDLGRRVADAIEVSLDAVRKLEPLPKHELTAEDHRRLGSLGSAGPRQLTTRAVTGSVPNQRADVPELAAAEQLREKAGSH